MSLEFALNATAPAAAAVDCVVVGAFADGSLSPAARALDAASGGRLAALLASGDLNGRTGKTALLHDLAGVAAPRVLVVGLGEAGKFGAAQYLKAVGDAARALKTGPAKSALFTLAELAVNDRDAAWNVRQAVIAADHACYRYLATLGEKNKKREEKGLERLEIPGSDRVALAQGIAIAAGVRLTRELGNLPPNLCTPAYIAAQAEEFAANSEHVECEVLDEAAMEQLGMVVQKFIQAAPEINLGKWGHAVDAVSHRAGFVVCGDLEVAARMVSAEPVVVGGPQVKDKIKELVLYSISEEFFAVRAQMGLTIAG